MSAKQNLLDEAAREYQTFQETIRGLKEEHMTKAWLGTWSVREIVAHISGWQRELGPALERIVRGEHPNPDRKNYEADVDAWNEKFVAPTRATPVADILLELAQSHEYFMHAAAQVPDDHFVEGTTAWKIVDLLSASHYKTHGAQIRAWRMEQQI